MPCLYQLQYLSLNASQPGTAWRSDVILDTPTLLSPISGDNICDENVTLAWEAVAGATWYIVQWCEASSFAGPTLQSARTASQSVVLDLDDLSLETKIYWRVFAYNETGGVSGKSESWEVTKACPDNPGNPDGSPLDADFTKCVSTGVKVSVDGPKWVMCCDLAMWHLQATWSHLDAAGNPILRLDNVVWTVVQNPNDPGNVIAQQNAKFCTIRINCYASQVFKLRCKLFFTDLRNSTQFVCSDEIKVFVDCLTGKPEYKPWLQSDDLLRHYMHPDYHDVSMRERQFPDLNMPLIYGADPSTIESTTSGPTALGPAQWGGEEHKQAIAWGPVARTGSETFSQPAGDGCGLAIGNVVGERPEARVHIPLGCGLRVSDRRITIDYDEIAGSGLRLGSECALEIDYGCGLKIDDDDRLAVDASAIAGPGLSTYSECGLQVYFGCGFTLDAEGRLIFDAESVAGSGLRADGDCGLAIDYGCGLMLDVNYRLAFDAESVAGSGLRVDGDCGLVVDYGCGLTLDSESRLAFDAESVAGPGLALYNNCGLMVDYGCGLKVSDGQLVFDRDAVMGFGLEASVGYGVDECGIGVALGDCGGLGGNENGEIIVETDSSALARTIWSLDPQSVVLSVSGCGVTLGMVVTPFHFYANCGGVLLGPILEGTPVAIYRHISLYYCCNSV